MNNQFVDGWTIVQTLGEGTFGEVKLLVNTNSRLSVAMKTIDLKNHSNALETGRKEAAIHCRLKHPNIVTYFGHRHTTNCYYIFLEYASGGELFDRIEPDVGMPPHEAKKYFIQLLAGVEYMHSKGVAHRDLKPENLLLDEQGILKISDFGLATMFICGEKRRKLERKCGTMPYIAPEVYANMTYHAEPADIWSCGVILVAMLAGELPWGEPSNKDKEYKLWKSKYYINHSPWTKLEPTILSLVRRMLTPSPAKRYNMIEIKSHYWFKLENRDGSQLELLQFRFPGDRSGFSQPAPRVDAQFHSISLAPTLRHDKMHFFSQPTQIENLMLSSQHLTSQSLSTANNAIQKLVTRMTRFILIISPEESLAIFSRLLDDMQYIWKINTPGLVTITTDECFVFKCNLISINRSTLMDFRLSKGCGLKFKRHFISIRQAMSQIMNRT